MIVIVAVIVRSLCHLTCCCRSRSCYICCSTKSTERWNCYANGKNAFSNNCFWFRSINGNTKQFTSCNFFTINSCKFS